MNMQSLTVLVLHDNQLTGSIPESFASLKNIMYIYLYSNKMTGRWGNYVCLFAPLVHIVSYSIVLIVFMYGLSLGIWCC